MGWGQICQCKVEFAAAKLPPVFAEPKYSCVPQSVCLRAQHTDLQLPTTTLLQQFLPLQTSAKMRHQSFWSVHVADIVAAKPGGRFVNVKLSLPLQNSLPFLQSQSTVAYRKAHACGRNAQIYRAGNVQFAATSISSWNEMCRKATSR